MFAHIHTPCLTIIGLEEVIWGLFGTMVNAHPYAPCFMERELKERYLILIAALLWVIINIVNQIQTSVLSWPWHLLLWTTCRLEITKNRVPVSLPSEFCSVQHVILEHDGRCLQILISRLIHIMMHWGQGFARVFNIFQKLCSHVPVNQSFI